MRMQLMVLCALLLLQAGLGAQAQTVQWSNEKLTVQAENAPLQGLVEEVARQTGVVLAGVDRLRGHRSIDFHDQPLLEGVRLLLEGVNYMVTSDAGVLHIGIHSMAGDVRPTVAGKGPIIIPGLSDTIPFQNVPLNDPDVVEDDEDEREEIAELEETLEAEGPKGLAGIRDAMGSEYPAVRAHALRVLGNRKDPEAISLVASALADEDVDVALTASDVLAAMPGQAAIEALASQLVPTADVDAQLAALRALALRADLASIPYVRRAAQEAHPLLRDYAAKLLRELEARQRAKAAADRKG